jgi:hypothetical protein
VTSLQGKRAVIASLVAACAVAVAGAATLSEVLSQQPVIAPEATQGAPAKPAGFPLPELKKAGCWEVTLADTELSARWVAECGDLPPVKLGVQPWRAGVLRLPGVGAEPLLAHVQAQATISGELAQRGEGALLFLPITAAGAGYYVAAWSVTEGGDAQEAEPDADVEPAAAPATQGYQVGRYGTAPVSVLTPAGRVYLQPDFAPHRALARNAALELESAEAPAVDSEPAATGAGEPTP